MGRRPGALLGGAALLAALLAGPGAGRAQAPDDLAMGRLQSPVLTLDVDRLLAETAFGRRLRADIEAQGERLKVENDRIAADLTAEERSLTERRPAMDPDAFRVEADAFDVRVQRIRAEQDAKQQALEAALSEGRDAFRREATPAIEGLMRDRGAVVIVERRDVVWSSGAVDVTDEAIAAIDAAIGDGGVAAEAPIPASPPEPDDSPPPTPPEGAEAGGG